MTYAEEMKAEALLYHKSKERKRPTVRKMPEPVDPLDAIDQYGDEREPTFSEVLNRKPW